MHLATIAQHHLDGENLRNWVRNSTTRDIRRAAMHRFVERRARAHARAREHPERPAEHRRLIRQDVPERVLGHDDVELERVEHELHGGIVHKQLAVFHIGIFGRDAARHLAPHPAHAQRIRLVDGVHTLAPAPRNLESHAHDALDLVFRILHRVIGVLARRAVDSGAGHVVQPVAFSKVEAAREFTHDHDIGSAHEFRLERRGADERLVRAHRAQVGIQPQALADSEQPLFDTGSTRVCFPFRASNGRQQHSIGGTGRFQRFRRQRLPRRVNRGAPDKGLRAIERNAEALADPREHLLRLGHDLRPNAVTGKQANVEPFLHAYSLSQSWVCHRPWYANPG